jgi:putative ABC transport system permease protein
LICVDQISTGIKSYFELRSKEILGGDIEITAANFRIKKDEIKQLQSFGKVSEIIEMRSMISFKEKSSLIELKSIDDQYPLYGELDFQVKDILNKEAALIAKELGINLGVEIGDEIRIGDAVVRVVGYIGVEPDWYASALVFGPRVMVSAKTLEKTGLLSPGSLIRYRYRLALHEDYTHKYVREKIDEVKKENSWNVNDSVESVSVLKSSVDRFEFFLILAGISNLIICGIGIASATKFFIEKKILNLAVLKSLGATKRDLIQIYMKLILGVSTDAFISSVILSAVLLYFTLPILGNYLPFTMEYNFYWFPALRVFVFTLATVITFSLPVLLNAVDISPVSLFRGYALLEFNHNIQKIKLYSISLLVLCLLIILYSDDVQFFIGYLFGMAMAFLLFFVVGEIFKKIISLFNIPNIHFRISSNNIKGVHSNLFIKILSIGISLTIFTILTTTQYNISEKITDTIPQQAPTLFLIDIQEPQIQELENMVKGRVHKLRIQPAIQGLLTKINGVDIDKDKVKTSSQWAIRSHRKLSYSNIAPDKAELVSGQWWAENYNGYPLVSMDARIAEGLGVGVGDRITFNVFNGEIEAEIANLRKIDYSTFNINFAFILSEGAINEYPKSYFATMKVGERDEEYKLIKEISKKYSNIITIRTADGIAIAEKYIGEIVFAIKIIVAISLIAGLVVLSSTFLSQQESRSYDFIVLKVLGAESTTIIKSLLVEAVIIGLIAGLIAIGLGNIGAIFILKYIKLANIYFSIGNNILLLLFTILVVCIVIVLSSFRLFRLQPADVLRNE